MSIIKTDLKKPKDTEDPYYYRPNLIRTEPFKWIYFPVFVVIWFILFWFILCPIVWSRVLYWKMKQHQHWSPTWGYWFWTIAALIFLTILGILLYIWRHYTKKERYYQPKNDADRAFLNGEYDKDKELMCSDCLTFHVPGPKNCMAKKYNTHQEICLKCGEVKESLNNCCHKKIQSAPTYDVVVEKQQPTVHEVVRRNKPKHDETYRHSLRSVKSRNSSSSSVVISTHNVDTKNIIAKNIALHETYKNEDRSMKIEGVPAKSMQSKKGNLAPVNVELANRYSNVEFFGEKIKLPPSEAKLVKSAQQVPIEPKSATPTSVNSMDSMDKQKFKGYLHLVEVVSPSTPVEVREKRDTVAQVHSPPLSPREIFFHDLIEASRNSESPDSTRFLTKRPTSHILVASDVDLDEKIAKYRRQLSDGERRTVRAPKSDATKSKTQVKIVYTTRKQSSSAGSSSRGPSSSDEVRSLSPLSPTSNASYFSEQMSANEINDGRNQSVSKYFITDIKKTDDVFHKK